MLGPLPQSHCHTHSRHDQTHQSPYQSSVLSLQFPTTKKHKNSTVSSRLGAYLLVSVDSVTYLLATGGTYLLVAGQPNHLQPTQQSRSTYLLVTYQSICIGPAESVKNNVAEPAITLRNVRDTLTCMPWTKIKHAPYHSSDPRWTNRD